MARVGGTYDRVVTVVPTSPLARQREALGAFATR
jgi:hypothetical protein